MTPAYEYTAATLLLTMALSPAQVPDWPKTQFGWQESCWAWVTETSPAKISARSEFIVDDAPAVRRSQSLNVMSVLRLCGARPAVGRGPPCGAVKGAIWGTPSWVVGLAVLLLWTCVKSLGTLSRALVHGFGVAAAGPDRTNKD